MCQKKFQKSILINYMKNKFIGTKIVIKLILKEINEEYQQKKIHQNQ